MEDWFFWNLRAEMGVREEEKMEVDTDSPDSGSDPANSRQLEPSPLTPATEASLNQDIDLAANKEEASIAGSAAATSSSSSTQPPRATGGAGGGGGGPATCITPALKQSGQALTYLGGEKKKYGKVRMRAKAKRKRLPSPDEDTGASNGNQEVGAGGKGGPILEGEFWVEEWGQVGEQEEEDEEDGEEEEAEEEWREQSDKETPDDSTKWRCTRCSLLNPDPVDLCIACDEPKSLLLRKKEQKAAQSQLGGVLKSHGGAVEEDNSKATSPRGWHNNHVSVPDCRQAANCDLQQNTQRNDLRDKLANSGYNSTTTSTTSTATTGGTQASIQVPDVNSNTEPDIDNYSSTDNTGGVGKEGGG